MKVVLDSNIIIQEFWMESPSFKILFESSKKGEIELFIPQVVIDECVNKFCEQSNELLNVIQNSIGKFGKTFKPPVALSIDRKVGDRTLKKYTTYIQEVILENDISIIPYPTVAHDIIAHKAMKALKPFGAKEKGYRDCLIWENIKSLVSLEEDDIPAQFEIIFITQNHTDFALNSSVHPDLIKELENDGLKTDSILIIPLLKEFNDKVTKLQFLQAGYFEEKLKNQSFVEFELKSIIDGYLEENFVNGDLDNYHEFVKYANDTPHIISITDDYAINTISVKQLNISDYIVEVKFDLEVEVDYFMDKYDYHSSDDLNVFLIDGDWNDHVVSVAEAILLPITMTLIINSKLECVGIEIDKIGKSYE